jgi:site-specific recombinase XerD
MFMLEKKDTCQAVSVKDYFRCTKVFFNWMVGEHILEITPFANTSLKPPKVPKKIIEPFKLTQISAMLSKCNLNTFLGCRNRAIILTFLDTGLRLSELAHVMLADVDIDHETIKVMGKGAKERVVRIGKHCQRSIIQYIRWREDDQPNLWVTEERKPLQSDGIVLMLRKICKKAAIEGVRCSPHTFRHTFATQSLRNGANVFELQRLLGHAVLDMTRRYADSLKSEQAIEAHRKFSPVDNYKF